MDRRRSSIGATTSCSSVFAASKISDTSGTTRDGRIGRTATSLTYVDGRVISAGHQRPIPHYSLTPTGWCNNHYKRCDESFSKEGPFFIPFQTLSKCRLNTAIIFRRRKNLTFKWDMTSNFKLVPNTVIYHGRLKLYVTRSVDYYDFRFFWHSPRETQYAKNNFSRTLVDYP